MPESLDSLLTELEDLSARAVSQTTAGDLTAARESIRIRGEALARLEQALPSAEPLSYEEWNRLAVIHFQGNRVGEYLQAARANLASQLVEVSREQALLHCVAGIAAQPTSRISETA